MGFFLLSASYNSQKKATAVLQPSLQSVIIDKNIYGHFVEHLGKGVYAYSSFPC